MKELGKELSHAGLFWQNILIKCDCSKFLLFLRNAPHQRRQMSKMGRFAKIVNGFSDSGPS